MQLLIDGCSSDNGRVSAHRLLYVIYIRTPKFDDADDVDYYREDKWLDVSNLSERLSSVKFLPI